ncbi:MAG: hypothetical protein IT383_29100 [Deltaproteobacteria bacterium]|nr:hypothetical protein [Deltaproteobacteria bacterium]
MARLFVLVALMVTGLAGCPKAGADAPTTATAAPSPTWWMSLSDGKLHRGLDEAPVGLYLGGEHDGERFVPGGDIEGNGAIGAKGEPAVLELSSGRMVKGSEPRPAPPLVDGALTADGFSPSSRKVRY